MATEIASREQRIEFFMKKMRIDSIKSGATEDSLSGSRAESLTAELGGPPQG
jgi:hypothetical protein